MIAAAAAATMEPRWSSSANAPSAEQQAWRR